MLAFLVVAAFAATPARTQSPPLAIAGPTPLEFGVQDALSIPIKPDAKKARDAYRRAVRAERDQDWQTAYTYYTDAVNWAPKNREYLALRELAKSRLVQIKVNSAERDAVAGRIGDARRELLSALYLDPSDALVSERLRELANAVPGRVPLRNGPEIRGEIQLNYEPGKRNFDYRGDTQGAYKELARQFGVEVGFDVDLHSHPVRFQLEDVDFPTAARLLGDMTGTFWRPLSSHLFFVADDTPQKRREYEPSVVRTALLPASDTPSQMTDLLRLVRDMTGLTRTSLDTNSRTLTLRGSPRAVSVASDLIDELEQSVGQLVLEFEILSVNRNYARQLGIVPPQTSSIVSLNSQQIQEAALGGQSLVNVIEQLFGLPSSLSGLSSAQIASLLASNQLGIGSLLPPVIAFGGGDTTFLATLPGAAANFSELLSLVRSGQRVLLRAEDGQPATFFVGDRIPVTLATYSASFAGKGANTPGVSSTNFPTTNYAVGGTPSFVATASLRDNGTNDLIVANSADNTVSTLLGNGDGTFATQTAIPVGTDPVWIATGAFASNANLNLDLAVANEGANTVSILLGNGDGTFTAGTPIVTGNAPVSVIAADFHDTTPNSPLDLAVANQGDNTVAIYQGNGDGTFQTPPTILSLPAGAKPSALTAADLNNDGHLDLVVANSGNDTISVFLGNGDGTFTQAPQSPYNVGSTPSYVVSGDFNDDGIPDLAVANSGAPFTASDGTSVTGNSVSILLGQAGSNGAAIGTFGTPTAYAAGNTPMALAVGDFNVDGLSDLVVADKGDNAISVLLNLGGGLFGPHFELPVGSAPVSVVAADFNGDGKTDVATANADSANATVILNSSSFSGVPSGLSGTPFPGVEYLDVGLKIKATPRIHPDGDVTLQLNLGISSLTTQSFNSIPVISNNSVDQTVRVKENHTAILAGFLQNQTTNAITGTPGITSLPGLDWLAQNQNAQQQDTELLILVTPRMVRLAPHKGRVIYAGEGALQGAPVGFNPPRVVPARPVPPGTPPRAPAGAPAKGAPRVQGGAVPPNRLAPRVPQTQTPPQPQAKSQTESSSDP